jgi:hypothetical protein
MTANLGPWASFRIGPAGNVSRFWEHFRRPGPIPSQVRGQIRLGPSNGLLNLLPAGGWVIGGFPFSLFLFLQGAQVHGLSPFGVLNCLTEHLYSALLSFFDRQSFLAGYALVFARILAVFPCFCSGLCHDFFALSPQQL